MDNFVSLDREEFSRQRAYLYALTIRPDVPPQVKQFIQDIEGKLSSLAEVKSHFEDAPINSL